MLMAAVYHTPHGMMVLISDEEHVGHSYYDQNKGLALLLPEKIYGGQLVGEEEALEMMRKAAIIVVTGEKAVSLAIKAGYVAPESVVRIRGVPHAQSYKISLV